MNKNESNKKVSILEFFKKEYLGILNLYQFVFLKNIILWASSYKMKEIDFIYNNKGFWVSLSKSIEWGMTKNQLRYAIRKLNSPVDKNNPSSIILVSAKAANMKKKEYGGSMIYISFNPTMLKNIIDFEALSEETKINIETFIDKISNEDIEKQTQSFLKLVNDKDKQTASISALIKNGLAKNKDTENKMREKLNEKPKTKGEEKMSTWKHDVNDDFYEPETNPLLMDYEEKEETKDKPTKTSREDYKQDERQRQFRAGEI